MILEARVVEGRCWGEIVDMRGVKEVRTLSFSVQNAGGGRPYRIENVAAYSSHGLKVAEPSVGNAFSCTGEEYSLDEGEHDADSTAVQSSSQGRGCEGERAVGKLEQSPTWTMVIYTHHVSNLLFAQSKLSRPPTRRVA